MGLGDTAQYSGSLASAVSRRCADPEHVLSSQVTMVQGFGVASKQRVSVSDVIR
jgi:hypothetical protein